MDTFRQSKIAATVGLMLGLFVSGSASLAGPSSVLDPYATIQPPSGRAQKQLMPESTAVETSTTYVNMDGDKPASPIRLKKPHLMGGHTVKPEKQEVAKTKVEKIKVSKGETTKLKTKKSSLTTAKTDDGMVGGTKTKLVDGTKSIGDGISSGAKASGSFFMKGAKAIGGGFKGGSGDDDKHPHAPGMPKTEEETRIGETIDSKKKGKSDNKIAAAKKKKDDDKDDKKDDKKKNGGVLSPISNTFKGTVFELKDGIHAATDKLSITKPKPGKDSAAERIAEKAKKTKHESALDSGAGGGEGTYIAKGKPVKKPSEGPGLMGKTIGKLPFMGSSKKSAPSESIDSQMAKKADPDSSSINLDPDNVPRKTAKNQSPLDGGM